jgi:hypothetical protein
MKEGARNRRIGRKLWWREKALGAMALCVLSARSMLAAKASGIKTKIKHQISAGRKTLDDGIGEAMKI